MDHDFWVGGEDGHRVLYFWHRVANSILTLFTNILIDMNLTDMESGYKAFKKEALENIKIQEIMKASRNNLDKFSNSSNSLKFSLIASNSNN